MKNTLPRPGKVAAVLAAGGLVLASLAFPATISLAQGHGHHGHHHGRGHEGGPPGGGLPSAQGALSITSAPWACEPAGVTCPSDTPSGVNLYTLTNANGMTVNISNYGGVIQSIWVPEHAGPPGPGREDDDQPGGHQLVDVVLGFKYLGDYVNDFENQPWPMPGGSGDTYFGAIIGRYANRIADHSFTLTGSGLATCPTSSPSSGSPTTVTYNLPANNDVTDTLHGGPMSYNTQVWAATTETGSNYVALKLQYTDPNCYNGFPGAVTNTVTYSLDNDNNLNISYNATTTAPTVVNFTNHAYFNLGGEASGDVLGQYLWINANQYQPTNAAQIPIGFVPVQGTAFDFTTFHPIGELITDASLPDGGGQTALDGSPISELQLAHGYDFNWALNGYPGFRLDAVAFDPGTGVVLKEYTDQPGVQLYTSNYLAGDLVGISGHTYRQTDAFTLETQHFPDTPHHQGDPQWPSVVLDPGQTFTSCTTYEFATAGPGFAHQQSFAAPSQAPLCPAGA
jgi:aldose 1-epimerase